jgi:hypothetical protein
VTGWLAAELPSSVVWSWRARHQAEHCRSDCTEEESPVLAIAYHDEDRVITCNGKIGSIDGDLAIDQPSVMAVDVQTLATDIGSGGQIRAIHIARDDAAHQGLDGSFGIGDKAVLTAYLTDRKLCNPTRILTHLQGLLDYVIGKAEAWLNRC